MTYPRPTVVASACLEFERVRYNGQSIPSALVRDLIPFVDFIRVCPEYEIGLGVPREPIRIVRQEGSLRLIQHKTMRDVTDEMNAFTERFIEGLGEVDGFIFKSRSPTMGSRGIKIYSGMRGAPVVDHGGGFFASRIAEAYPGHPLEEENRLRNRRIRDHFLTVLFAFAGYREVVQAGELEAFDSRNHLLFRYYGQDFAAKLDPAAEGYLDIMKEILKKPPSSDLIAGFFTELLGEHEIVERYRKNRVSLETLYEVAEALVGERYSDQSLFAPYPPELAMVAEEQRDRDYWK